MLMCCYALPPYPRRSNGLALVAVVKANALHLPLAPKPGWPVSPVLWVLYHALGHLKQPWNPWILARQEPLVGATCPVTPADGTISGYDYDYDYVCRYVCMYVCCGVAVLRWLVHVVGDYPSPQRSAASLLLVVRQS